MTKPHSSRSLRVCLLACLSVAQPLSTSPAQEAGAKTWVGHYQEVEDYLRTAECVGMENIGRGSSSGQRCVLRPGGPASRMLWKPLIPGVYRGFKESYKSEIAAYELDKLLKLDMVPPVVERELQGHKGSATLWVDNLLAFNSGAPPSASDRSRWETQLTQAKMFDNVIGNKDRNQGNIARDAGWNIILLDHARAFTAGTELTHSLTKIDQDLWARMDKLTRKQLDARLGPWLDENEIAAIVDRLQRMKADIKRRLEEAALVP
jgi:hypothetical protein